MAAIHMHSCPKLFQSVDCFHIATLWMNNVHGQWGCSDQHNPILAFGYMTWHVLCRRGGRTVLPDRQHEMSQYRDKTRLVQHFGYDAEDVEHMAERYLDEDLPGAVQVSPQEVVRPRYIPDLWLVLHVHPFKLLAASSNVYTKSGHHSGGWMSCLSTCRLCTLSLTGVHRPNRGMPLCQ